MSQLIGTAPLEELGPLGGVGGQDDLTFPVHVYSLIHSTNIH